MGTGNDTANDIRAILANYKESHKRLRDPPNAVPDAGIDLKRHKVDHVQPLIAEPTWRWASPPPPPSPPPTPPKEIPACWTGKLFNRRIIASVADYFRVTPADITGHCRGFKYIRPRQMACYLLRELTGKSFPTIGTALGGRDHTTMLYSYRKIERQIRENHRQIASHYSNIMALIDADTAAHARPAVPAVAEPVVAIELENPQGLPQPEIHVMAEASGTALVDTKTAKFSNYYWPIYGGNYSVTAGSETPRHRQSLEGFAGCIAELAHYRERQILAWSSASVGEYF